MLVVDKEKDQLGILTMSSITRFNVIMLFQIVGQHAED